MDSWTTRYTHNGVSYVHDSYTGTTMLAAVYDAIMTSSCGGRTEIKPIPKCPLKGKTVTCKYGDTTVTGKVMGYDDSDGTVLKIKTATGIAYCDANGVQ